MIESSWNVPYPNNTRFIQQDCTYLEQLKKKNIQWRTSILNNIVECSSRIFLQISKNELKKGRKKIHYWYTLISNSVPKKLYKEEMQILTLNCNIYVD